MARKPEGSKEAESLLRKLAQVPKRELDKVAERDARKKAAKRKK
jgi:hypothetical protein